MIISNANLITEEVKLDERQKSIIGEISTDCIRLWYTLNMTVTLFAAVFVLALSGIITVGRTYVIAVLIILMHCRKKNKAVNEESEEE